MRKYILPAVAILLAAGPAASQSPVAPASSPIAVSASARTMFEELTLGAGADRVRRSVFTQSYAAAGSGPLGLPSLGRITANATFNDGDNLARLVQNGQGRQRESAFRVTGDLLPPEARAYVTVSPYVARSQYTAGAVGSPQAMQTDATVGGTVGLTLPNLPQVQVTMDRLDRTSTVAGTLPGPGTLTRHERATWARGPVRADYQRHVLTTAAAAGAGPGPATDAINGSLEFLRTGMTRGPLRDAQVRLDGRTTGTGAAGRMERQDGGTQSARWVTQSANLGPVTAFMAWGQTATTDSLSPAIRFGQDVSLAGRLPGKGWEIGNQVQWRQAVGTVGRRGTAMNRINAQAGGRRWAVEAQEEGGLERGGGTPGAVLAYTTHKVTWTPHTMVQTFLRQTYGATWYPRGGPLGARLATAEAGGLWRIDGVAQLQASHQRNYGGAAASLSLAVRDETSAGLTGGPTSTVTAGVNWHMTRDLLATGAAATPAHSVSVDGGWRPSPRTDVTARAARSLGGAGLSFNRSTATDASLSVRYTVGRLSAEGTVESRELAMIRPWQRVALSLTRTF